MNDKTIKALSSWKNLSSPIIDVAIHPAKDCCLLLFLSFSGVRTGYSESSLL